MAFFFQTIRTKTICPVFIIWQIQSTPITLHITITTNAVAIIRNNSSIHNNNVVPANKTLVTFV